VLLFDRQSRVQDAAMREGRSCGLLVKSIGPDGTAKLDGRWASQEDLVMRRAIPLVLAVLALAACGATVEQRAATGAIAGAVVAGPVGAAVGGAAGTAVGRADPR
jgi:osmotically inducible lipoprotein OsmB